MDAITTEYKIFMRARVSKLLLIIVLAHILVAELDRNTTVVAKHDRKLVAESCRAQHRTLVVDQAQAIVRTEWVLCTTVGL